MFSFYRFDCSPFTRLAAPPDFFEQLGFEDDQLAPFSQGNEVAEGSVALIEPSATGKRWIDPTDEYLEALDVYLVFAPLAKNVRQRFETAKHITVTDATEGKLALELSKLATQVSVSASKSRAPPAPDLGKIKTIYHGGRYPPLNVTVSTANPGSRPDITFDSGQSLFAPTAISFSPNNVFGFAREYVLGTGGRLTLPLRFDAETFVQSPLGLYLLQAANSYCITSRGLETSKLVCLSRGGTVKHTWPSKIDFLGGGNRLDFVANLVDGFPTDARIKGIRVKVRAIVEIN